MRKDLEYINVKGIASEVEDKFSKILSNVKILTCCNHEKDNHDIMDQVSMVRPLLNKMLLTLSSQKDLSDLDNA
jgi:hypothetical protein